MKDGSHIRQTPILTWLIAAAGLSMIAYHILSVIFPVLDALLHQNIHLGFSLVLLLLVIMRDEKNWAKLFWGLGLILSIVVVVFIHLEQERLQMWAGFPEVKDIFIGISLVGLIAILTWKNWGSIFLVLIGLSVIYALWGHHVEGALGHPKFDPKLVLSNLGIGFDGVYGMLLNASANLIFLFIIFGNTFEAVGIDKFFLEIGTFLGKHLKGGAAQTAVFSSSFVGMCTGAAAANVALTGSYTIPLMKKTGFEGKHAGAIEAVASTGGQLTPPIMGVAVFLMASFLGVSYSSLMATALIPAVMFYLMIFVGVILIAFRENIPMLTAKINGAVVIQRAPLFIIPMGLITWLLIAHYTPAYAAISGIGTLLAISLIRKETRPKLSDLLNGLVKGAIMGASIGVACAAIGMFTSMLTFTGAGPKLAGLIEVLAGGHLTIALVLTMALSILLGCAMPTPVAYMVTALVVAPVLVNMGLSLLTAHFFVFYFAILSAVTPPVAGAAVVGSRIAKAHYLATGWEALKLAAPFFLVPYFLVQNPIVLSKAQAFGSAVSCLIAMLVSCTSIMIMCQGFCFTRVNFLERALFFVTGIIAVYHGLSGNVLAFWAAIIIFTVLMLGQWRKWAHAKTAT
jgi:TRAP transporter 4TM/12TM fusion protein